MLGNTNGSGRFWFFGLCWSHPYNAPFRSFFFFFLFFFGDPLRNT